MGFAASAAQSDTPKEMVVLGLQVDQQFRQNIPAWSFNQILSRQKAAQNMLYSATYMETLPVATGGKQWSCLAEALYFEAPWRVDCWPICCRRGDHEQGG